jgi:hypothetical protein
MSTATTSHINTALPPSNSSPFKLTDQAASKTTDTEVPALSLFSAGALNARSSDPLPSGASFLLEIHRRREHSATPSQKLTRKEREFLEQNAHPSFSMTSMDLSLPRKSAPPPQSMSKKERNSLLEEALHLMSED